MREHAVSAYSGEVEAGSNEIRRSLRQRNAVGQPETSEVVRRDQRRVQKRKRGGDKSKALEHPAASTLPHNYFEEVNDGGNMIMVEIFDLTIEMVNFRKLSVL
jgi:hypothetical protein